MILSMYILYNDNLGSGALSLFEAVAEEFLRQMKAVMNQEHATIG